MFQRLYELSRFLPEHPTWERLNEGMPPEYDRGLAICFNPQGEFTKIDSFIGNSGIIYRSGPPNGTDVTPCCKFAGDTANRLLRAVKNLAEYQSLSDDKKTWLAATIRCFEQHKDNIWTQVEIKMSQAGVDGKQHRAYIYWAGDNSADPVYQWPEAKNFMVDDFLRPFAKGGTRSGHCLVCDQPDKTVYGNYSVLACYNLDKPGSIAGGFTAAQAHRNLPVCGECALSLAEAFAFAERHLTSTMAGQNYMILPYSNVDEINEELHHSLKEKPDKYYLAKTHDLVVEELALMREYANRGDQLALYLIFFKAENAAWRIQAEVQQLLPSRLHALHNAAKAIERATDLATADKEGIKFLKINALTLQNFSGTAASASADTFRAWLVALFEDHPVDYRHFLHHLVSKLISTGKTQPDLLPWMTRQAWGLYRYALLTRFISPTHPKENNAMQEAVPNSPYGRYIETHPDFFRKPELAIAFLTGCYASQVASVQRQERKSAPFTKKFIGHLLSKQHLQRLYREGHAKLAQYDKLGYVITGLDPDLAAAWVACGDRWTISDEEATFAFTIGYSLAYRISQLESKQDNQETEE